MDILFYFIIYAFLGWCLEVAYAALCDGRFVNRGFLNGPVCPIYGFGVVIVITLLSPLADNLIILFIGSVVLTSVMEYVTGFLLEKLFHEKWWDYSDIPFNLNGYICPKFSLLWGFACVFVVRLVHPTIAALVGIIPPVAKAVTLAMIFAALAVDCALTIASVLKIRKHIRGVEEMEQLIKRFSDQIGEKISDGVINVRQKSPEIEEALAELQEKYRDILKHAKDRRLLRAFPNLKKLKKSEAIEKIKQTIAELKEKR